MIMRANDGSGRAPRMEIHQAMWALKCYGSEGREWTLEEKLERIAEAGFTGIFGSLPDQAEEKQWRRLLDRYGLSFGLESFPGTSLELSQLLDRAGDFPVLYVNAQVPDAYTTGQEAVARLASLMETADRYKVPFFMETHRGQLTQDLLRTVEYVRELACMRLTIDFSHYVLAGEMYNFE
ncbi:sugar phosphate isomerase/epimerase family protein [Paenibacillus oenotherae]|uniref:sugar phosphate isomerase/epimerase family protein n=1 Tax=Paenibacillus oenotherae TaxID=1435645 RepID=UPI001FE3403C|nr:sugar phosphate isomerase/epimerase [Paenibacillus oenotherae]